MKITLTYIPFIDQIQNQFNCYYWCNEYTLGNPEIIQTITILIIKTLLSTKNESTL
jgi:hypothetical protein